MYKGSNKGHLGGLDKVLRFGTIIIAFTVKFYVNGLDKVFKIRDHHHRIHRQILRQNEGLILILAQS